VAAPSVALSPQGSRALPAHDVRDRPFELVAERGERAVVRDEGPVRIRVGSVRHPGSLLGHEASLFSIGVEQALQAAKAGDDLGGGALGDWVFA